MMDKDKRGSERYSGNQVLGILLVVAGVLFLIGQMFGFNFWNVSWPLFIIVPGVLLGLLGLSAKASGTPLTIVGTIVTLVGLVLLYQTLTNHFESWAYMWALVAPGGVGLGMWLHGTWTKDEKLTTDGRNVLLVGLALTAIGWIFFELVIGIGGFVDPTISRLAGPALLIVIGGYLLWRRNREQIQ
jgi:hypothetical protein